MRCCNDVNKKIYMDGVSDECKCLPACTSIAYDADVSQADYDLVSTFSKSRLEKNFNFEK